VAVQRWQHCWWLLEAIMMAAGKRGCSISLMLVVDFIEMLV
jgi:hypothetical protein